MRTDSARGLLGLALLAVLASGCVRHAGTGSEAREPLESRNQEMMEEEREWVREESDR